MLERRLVTILAADAVSYSRLMAQDEEQAFSALSRARAAIDRTIRDHSGRIFGEAGDSVIAEFASPVKAVQAAIAVQEALADPTAGTEPAQSAADGSALAFRIGVHLGDVIVKEGNLLGDGVNVASRLEAIAPEGGICISETVKDAISGKVKTPFGNAGRHRLKNIPKPVGVWCWPDAAAARLRRRAAPAAGVLAGAAVVLVAGAALLGYVWFSGNDAGDLPGGPRIAVMPFENIGGGEENDFFSDGLTRDINAQLSRFSNLFVIAPSAVRSFDDGAGCEEIRREVDADYILAGTVRRSNDKIRVTTNFTDAGTCRQLVSPGPFDRDLSVGNIMDIQLEIARNVVAQVGSADAPLFNAPVQSELRRKAPESLQAYECVLLSYWFYETFAPDRHRRARACLEQAVQREPNYSLGWSRLAFSYIEAKKYSIDTPADWAERASEAAYRAIDIDPSNPDAYYALAILSQMRSEEPAVFRQFAEKAVQLNPNDAFVLADLGTWMAYSGEWEKGKDWVSRAKLLNPKHQSWWDYIWHLHHFLKGEYAEARDVALKVNLPNNYMVQASLTASYAMNGEMDKAHRALSHLLEIRPDYAEDPRAPFRTRGMPDELIEGLMAGLKKAGLEIPPV